MRRALILLVLPFVLPASAQATAELTSFSVEPADLQAGGHPDVVIRQTIAPSGSDDVKDTFTRLAPGLLGNPQNAALCTSEQLRSSEGCPDDAKVGSVVVSARLGPLYLPPDVPVNGTVYNLKPTGGEPARLGLELNALAGVAGTTYLEAPVTLRPGPDGIGLETLFPEQPRDADGLDIQIRGVELTFDGEASKGPFMRMPTSCATGTSLARINSWDAPDVFSQLTHTITPTGCDALPFQPRADGSVGSPDQLLDGDFPPFSTTLRLDPEGAALNRAEVTLPTSLAPNQAALMRACLRPQADATACPETSRMGTAIIDSPLQAQPVRGPVYLAFNTPAPLPGLMVVLPPPVDLRIDAVVETGAFGVRNVFPTNPDLPLRSFTLEFFGGPDGILQLTDDLCGARTPTAITARLTAHSGKVSEFKQELATPGCDPRARVTLRRKRKRWTLAAVLTAARRGPDITSARVTLPKPLRRGKPKPRIHVDGRRVAVRRAKRAVKPRLAGGARRIKIVWRGLKVKRGKKLRPRAAVPVRMVDERGKTFALRPRAPRG